MTDSKSELIIAKTILSAQAEVIISREKRCRNIREKALRAYAERKKLTPHRKPMTAEERRAVWNTLKYVNKLKEVFVMLRISDESYERVTEILEDIGYACKTSDYYEDWENIARPSFCVMDALDAERYEMTCEAIREKIIDLNDKNKNFAKGIHAAFLGYLKERRDYLEFNGYYDKPELPEDADEDDIDLYNELLEKYV